MDPGDYVPNGCNNGTEGISLVALSWENSPPSRLQSHCNRYQVTLFVEFFYPELATAFAHTDLATKVDEKSWQINA